jgi:hypothetical protein
VSFDAHWIDFTLLNDLWINSEALELDQPFEEQKEKKEKPPHRAIREA